MWVLWLVVIVLVATAAIEVLRRGLLAIVSSPCGENGCPGNVWVEYVALGTPEVLTECLVCERCGHTVPVPQQPLPW